MNIDAVNIHMQFLCEHVFLFLFFKNILGIVGSYGNSMSNPFSDVESGTGLIMELYPVKLGASICLKMLLFSLASLRALCFSGFPILFSVFTQIQCLGTYNPHCFSGL